MLEGTSVSCLPKNRLSPQGFIILLKENPSSVREEFKWFNLFVLVGVFLANLFSTDGVADSMPNPPSLPGLETGSNRKRATGGVF